jgi:branched-chain amino acid transport system substrate-binding protein
VDYIRLVGSTDPGKIRDALAETKDYSGVAATISIDGDRNTAKPVVFLRIGKGRFLALKRWPMILTQACLISPKTAAS